VPIHLGEEKNELHPVQGKSNVKKSGGTPFFQWVEGGGNSSGRGGKEGEVTEINV